MRFNKTLSNPIRYCFSIPSCYFRKMGGAYICVFFTGIIINVSTAFIGFIKSFQFFYRLRKPMPLHSICSLNTNVYYIPVIVIHADTTTRYKVFYNSILSIFRKPH